MLSDVESIAHVLFLMRPEDPVTGYFNAPILPLWLDTSTVA